MAQLLDQADILIRNGRVIDPENNRDEIADVLVQGGRIREVGPGLACPPEVGVFDASGLLVTPGLVDSHAHVYEACTPLGVNPDRFCLGRGVTTVVDAGSAGASTFPGLKKFIIGPSETRVLALLHIAAHGLAAAGCVGPGAGGECDSLNQVNSDLCVSCLNAHRDVAVGVKVRLAVDVANKGEFEEEVYRRALSVASRTGLPLMVHHAISSVPTQGNKDLQSLCCPGNLRRGDIYTHCYHGFPSTIIDDVTNNICDDVIEARKRGVLFDVGHGQGSFSWTVAELCAKVGFWPDMISTDLHSGNYDGPVYDLPCIMTKLMHLGMPIYDVIKATTATPARSLDRLAEFGTLSVGICADVTVLRQEDCDFDLEDSQGQLRRIKKQIVPVAVWRNGKRYEILPRADSFPNVKKGQQLAEYWVHLSVRDSHAPMYC